MLSCSAESLKRPRFTSNSARKFDSSVEAYSRDKGALEGREGALMTVACGQCGTESPRTAKFCSECGAKLHQPSVEPERADRGSDGGSDGGGGCALASARYF